jgi:hypothetical protein
MLQCDAIAGHLSRLLVLGCGLAVCICGNRAWGEHRLDDRTSAILKRADKVEVFYVDGSWPPKSPAPGEKAIGGWRVTSQGRDQGPEFATRLADILADEASYSQTFAGCFYPGVAFRVWSGEDCVDCILCFYCDNFYLGPPVEGRFAYETASFYDTPARRRLVRLAKEAFPDDPDIQNLWEVWYERLYQEIVRPYLPWFVSVTLLLLAAGVFLGRRWLRLKKPVR